MRFQTNIRHSEGELFSVHCWTRVTSSVHESSSWPRYSRTTCITAPFQTIRHSCCHLSPKGHCKIWGGQTSRCFLTEGPSRWIKWAEMPRKHLTYMKGASGHMPYRQWTSLRKTSRDKQEAQLLFPQKEMIFTWKKNLLAHTKDGVKNYF